MKIRVTEGMEIKNVEKGCIYFTDHNNTELCGWIKRIYGVNELNEIAVNEAEFIPENMLVELATDMRYDLEPYTIQITGVYTQGSCAELRDGKLERVIEAKLASFNYLGYSFEVSEDEDTWIILSNEGECIDAGIDISKVIKFMYNTYTNWITRV